MTARARLSYRFRPAEIARLWLSYQRYALLCFTLAAALVAAAAAWAPGSYLAWVLVAAPVAALAGFGAKIYARWPRKLRATALASRRIESGRFQPVRLRDYCGDPCFRVVAREILTRAGYSRRERRRIIGEHARDARAPLSLLQVDHNAASVRVDGNEVGTLSQEGEPG